MYDQYARQARYFINSTKTDVKTLYLGKSYPDWDKENLHDSFTVTITRDRKLLTLPFYDSIDNTEKKVHRLKAYDILASIDPDVEPSLGNFIQDFGYEITTNSDYIRISKIHTDLVYQAEKLREMYSEDELERLREIV